MIYTLWMKTVLNNMKFLADSHGIYSLFHLINYKIVKV